MTSAGSDPASAPVYLDNAATTPVDPRVATVMGQCLTGSASYGNPASTSHSLGDAAREQVEQARAQVAGLVGATPAEIVWTSGATESNNLAIKGVARFHRDRGQHIVTCKTEHKAVLDSCAALEKEGFAVTYLVPREGGRLAPAQVAEALRDDTVLVTVMHANNETGVVNDIAGIGEVCADRGVLFHVDAAQSAGKLPIDLAALPVQLMSFSAHKLYGPKGVGALFVRNQPRTLLEPQMHGGGHERGLRSGTLPTHQVVGMGEAFRIAAERLAQDARHASHLCGRLWTGIEPLGGVLLNGDPGHRLPTIVNVSVDGVEGESLLFALRRLAVSSGSACTSATAESSYVLRALGRPDAQPH